MHALPGLPPVNSQLVYFVVVNIVVVNIVIVHIVVVHIVVVHIVVVHIVIVNIVACPPGLPPVASLVNCLLVVVADIGLVVIAIVVIIITNIVTNTIASKPDQQNTCWSDLAGFSGPPPSHVSSPHRAQECHTVDVCCKWETCV